jgi:hypothetical protein
MVLPKFFKRLFFIQRQIFAFGKRAVLKLPRGQHDMNMRVDRLPFFVSLVHVHVGNDALSVDVADKVFDQIVSVFIVQSLRDGRVNRDRGLAVLPLLDGLGLVP